VVVSDLHLGSGGSPGTAGEHFFHDGAFAAFVDHLLVTGPPPVLVALGDLFDLSGISPGPLPAGPGLEERRTVRRLERVADGHPAVFSALRRLLAAGGRLEVVAGNHDQEITRPAARVWLERTLGGNGGVRVHPWVLYRPGLLYAEHGSQYHDINALVAVARPLAPDDQAERPLAAALGAGPGRRRPLGALRRAAAVAAGGVRLSTPGVARERAAYRAGVLPALAAAVGLPEAVLGALDRLSETTAPAIARRLLARLVLWAAGRALRRQGPVMRPSDRSAYLRRVVPHVDAILAEAGCGVPFYVFGHTHFAEEGQLPHGHRYLNAGTWSEPRPASLGPAGTLTFVEITADPPVARLRRWDAAADRPVDLGDVGPEWLPSVADGEELRPVSL
jgi:UDP-2,3-diacylglucosamine pyrophosphatase LpxH